MSTNTRSDAKRPRLRLKLRRLNESRNESISSQAVVPAQIKAEKIECGSYQKFKDIPLTDAAQSEMLARIETLKVEITRGQVILRAVLEKIPDNKKSSDIVQREIIAFINSPLVLKFVVSLLGETGAGKSKMISALLDKPYITESSCAGKATTHMRIQFGENPESQDYEGQSILCFVDEPTFRATIDIVYDALADTDAPESERGPVAKVIAYCGKEISALLKVKTKAHETYRDEKTRRRHFAEHVLKCGPRKLLGTEETTKYKTWQQLRDDVKEKLADSQHGGKVRWPILVRVRILLNDDTLANGLCLEDNPGYSDVNAINNQMGLTAATESDAVILAAPMSRANSNSIHWNQVKSTISRLYQQGSLHKIVLVGTFADRIDIDETVQSLQLTSEQELLQERLVARERKEELEKSLTEIDDEYESQAARADDCDYDIQKWQNQQTSLGQNRKIRGPQNLRLNEFGIMSKPFTSSKIAAHLRTLGQARDEAESRCYELQSMQQEYNDELDRLNVSVISLDVEYKRRTFDACVKHVANTASENFLKEVKLQEDRSLKHAVEIMDKEALPKYHSEGDWKRLKELTFPIMVASTAHLQPDHPNTFIPREKTGIYDVALRVKGINMAEQYEHLRSLKKKMDAAIATIERATSSDNPEMNLVTASLAPRLDFSRKLDELPSDLQHIMKTALSRFEAGFMSEFTSAAKKLKLASLRRAKLRMDEFRTEPTYSEDSEELKSFQKDYQKRTKGLHVAEYRAVTAPSRQGVWEGTRVFLDFNDTVAAVIKMYCSTPLRAVFTTVANSQDSGRAIHALPRCGVRMAKILKKRHLEFKSFAEEVNLNTSVLYTLNEQIRRRMAIIRDHVRAAKKKMSRVHSEAMAHINGDIRTAYLNGYETAHAEHGAGAKGRMAEALRDALKEDGVVTGAIDKLEERLRESYTAVFDDLRNQVTQTTESMRNDYNQALQDHEAGFFKITDNVIKEDIRLELEKLHGFGKSAGKVEEEETPIPGLKRRYESDDEDYPSYYLSEELSDED